MTIELDKLMFGISLNEVKDSSERAEIIEHYLLSCGWTWDLVLEEICNESTNKLQSRVYH